MIFTTAHSLAASISQRRWVPQGEWWDDVRRERPLGEIFFGPSWPYLQPYLGGSPTISPTTTPIRTSGPVEPSTHGSKESEEANEITDVEQGRQVKEVSKMTNTTRWRRRLWSKTVEFLMHLGAYLLYVNAPHEVRPDASALILCSIPLAIPGK
jgi:hypothetical protein